MSGGWFAFAGTPTQRDAGIEDDDAHFFDELCDEAEGFADAEVLRALVDQQRTSREWLERHAQPDIVKISAGMRRARSHRYDIAVILQKLRGRLEADSAATLLMGCGAESLVVDDRERVVGVRCRDARGQLVIAAKSGVVLASGGFSRSRELLRRFAPAQLSAIPYGGVGNAGDGLQMAWRLGADVCDMGFLSGTYGSHPLTTDDEHELLSAYYFGAIIVNRRGERFADEASSYKTLGTRCLEQPDGLGFQIFDERIMAQSIPGAPLSDIRALQRKGRIHSAPSLTELAEKSGIDGEELARTVADYNGALARGGPAGRSGLVNGVGSPTPIDAAPFYCYPAKTLMTSTYGGLRVTPTARVVRIDDTTIDGLTAAGEVAGGFHGPGYMTGSALTKALVFGRIAANTLLCATN